MYLIKKVAVKHPESFAYGVRIIYKSARAKDGHKTPKREIEVNITYGPYEYAEVFDRLWQDMQDGERIYASVSPRDEHKARAEFSRRKVLADYSKRPEDFYRNVDKIWRKCLGKSDKRQEQLFLFDADGNDEVSYFDTYISTYFPVDIGDQTYRYTTKNGAHFITPPFNYTALPILMQEKMKKNAMILLAYTV